MKQMVALALLGAAVGCAPGTDEDLEMMGDLAVDQKTQEIQSGTAVTTATSLWRYVVKVPGCTGSIIGPRHVLTAAHCGSVNVGAKVKFYSATAAGSGSPIDNGTVVEQVYLPWGVTSSDLTDSDGDFADYRVLYLNKVIPSANRVAPIAWSWPGRDVSMVQIGAGQHDGANNGQEFLEYRNDLTYTINDDSGRVETKNYTTNDGDSGGPLLRYDNDLGRYVVYGALFGMWWHDFKNRTRYSSANFHSSEILEAMGHVLVANKEYTGATIRTTTDVSMYECASRCMANDSCTAYSWDPGPVFVMGTCREKSSQGSTVSESGSMSGYKRSAGTGSCTLSGGACRL